MQAKPREWQQWRRRTRTELIGARQALTRAQRRARDREIDQYLAAGFAAFAGTVVAFCWPIRGEPEPRFAIRRWRDAGARAALPVIVAPRTAMIFRHWWPGVAMARDVYQVPFPIDSPEVTPAAALVPVAGFDEQGYRLGYGSGYFDRPLAAQTTRPVTVALGYELQRLPSIAPQPHDMPFDFVVGEAGIQARIDDHLVTLDPKRADARVRGLQAERGLA